MASDENRINSLRQRQMGEANRVQQSARIEIATPTGCNPREDTFHCDRAIPVTRSGRGEWYLTRIELAVSRGSARRKRRQSWCNKTAHGQCPWALCVSRQSCLDQLANRIAIIQQMDRPAAAAGEGHGGVDAQGVVDGGHDALDGAGAVLGVFAAGA